jgi:hypothetical protein
MGARDAVMVFVDAISRGKAEANHIMSWILSLAASKWRSSRGIFYVAENALQDLLTLSPSQGLIFLL